jgi:hypothetical protein
MNPTFMLIPSCLNSDRPFSVILRPPREARLSKDERPREAKDKGHLTGPNSKIGSGGQGPLWVDFVEKVRSKIVLNQVGV